MEDKEELLEMGVTESDNLGTSEKEVNVNFPKDRDFGWFHTDIGTMIKWFLSVEETEVTYYKTNDEGKITQIKGKIPKGIIKLQSSTRKSSSHSQMVSYGPKK
jgi:hypothetical protein